MNTINKIKDFFNSVVGKIILALSAIVGLLAYFITLKNKEVASLKTEIDLVNTKQQADVLETEIKQKLEDSKLLQKEIDEYNKALVELEEKRKSIPNDHDPVTYWNKK